MLGAGLAIGDHVSAVVDEAASRAEADGAAAGRGRHDDRNDRTRPTELPVLNDQADSTDQADPTDRTARSTGNVVVPLDRSAAKPPAAMRHVVIGAVSEVGDRTTDVVTGVTHLVNGAVGRVTPLASWAWHAPMLGPVRSRSDDAVRRLAERGRQEERIARRQANETFGLTVGAVSASVVIDRVIAEVLDRNLQPILENALPKALADLQARPDLLVPLVESIVGEVLQPILDSAIPNVMGDLESRPELILPLVESIVGKALQPILDQALPLVMDDISRQPELLMPLVMGIVDEALEPLLQAALPRVIAVLNEDPDAIRSLVRDQSTGIAAEMTETVRFRAADADERIDRIVRRVLRRKSAVAPPLEPPRAALALDNPASGVEALAAPSTVTVTGIGTSSAHRDGHPSIAPEPEGDR